MITLPNTYFAFAQNLNFHCFGLTDRSSCPDVPAKFLY